MLTAPTRPIFFAAAYPKTLPAPAATTGSGFTNPASTLMYAGGIGEPYSKSPIGWLPQGRQKVDGGFREALASAQALARVGADASKYTPPGQSTRTHLAAVIQTKDGAFHIAPVFVQSFDDDMRNSAWGTSMWRRDEFMPSLRTEVVALAGPRSWIDARPSAPHKDVPVKGDAKPEPTPTVADSAA